MTVACAIVGDSIALAVDLAAGARCAVVARPSRSILRG
jgi:hypothetical protein